MSKDTTAGTSNSVQSTEICLLSFDIMRHKKKGGCCEEKDYGKDADGETVISSYLRRRRESLRRT